MAATATLLGTAAYSAEVKHEAVRQEGNRVLITYDLEGSEGEADVSLQITIEGKPYSEKELHLEGDIGKVKIGPGRRIAWNVLQDFPRGLAKGVSIELQAGGQALKGPLTGMEMVFVKGGCYRMGDTSGIFGDGYQDEKPVHEVCIDDFYLGKFEVTQGQWRTIMGNNPSHFKDCGDECPVEMVSYDDIQGFIARLNRGSGKGCRLPTEAEWEYAARSGGKDEKWAGTSSQSELGDIAWYSANSGSKTHPVGQKRPNGLGLYDMSGNVWEWVADWYQSDYYKNSPRSNPTGPSSASRVRRGGSWGNGPRVVRSAYRGNSAPALRGGGGFRCAKTP